MSEKRSKRRLRVLVDVHHLYVAETGIRKVLEQFIQLAQQDGERLHEYHFIPRLDRVNQRDNFRKKNLIFFRMLSQLETLIWKQIYIPYCARRFKADVVFFPDYYAPAVRMKATKMIMFYDTFFWDSPGHYGKLWLKYFKRVIFKGLDERSSILTITEHSARKIEGIIPKPIDVKSIHLPNTRDHYEKSPLGTNLKSMGLTELKYFLHVGVFEKRKEIPVLIKAFRKFLDHQGDGAQYRLVLVGRKAPNQRFDDSEEVDRLTKELELTEHIVRPGYLSDSDINALYSNALGYVFPSRNEGFGLPVVEAFHFNCPVIISNQGALKEVAGDAALVFDIGDVQGLANRMKQLTDNEQIRTELLEKGQQRLKSFDRTLYFRKMEDYITSLVAEHDE